MKQTPASGQKRETWRRIRKIQQDPSNGRAKIDKHLRKPTSSPLPVKIGSPAASSNHRLITIDLRLGWLGWLGLCGAQAPWIVEKHG
jgi:hypothetical protein